MLCLLIYRLFSLNTMHMKKRYTQKLASMILLSLISWLPVMAQNSIEIKTMEQLQEVLSSPQLRSDDVLDRPITAEGIIVDEIVPVSISSYRMHGGPLIRAEGYTGVILSVKDGGNITIENTIDGADLNIQNKPLIEIQKGGTLTLAEGGSFQRNRGTEHALCVMNFGTFNLDGGSITHNVGEDNHVIFNSGTAHLLKGEIAGNETRGSIYSGGTTVLNASAISLSGTDATLWVDENFPINLTSSLTSEIIIETIMDEGDVVAIGGGVGNYTLTASDLAKISIKNLKHPDLKLSLINNQIILSKSSSGTGEITTEKELQDAIDNASGTSGAPTTITIAEKGITLSAPVTIDGKYLKITGGTIKADFSKTQWLTMFEIKSGVVKFENIKLDGAKSAATNNWCTFIRQSGGSCYLENGTILTNALGHYDWYNGILVTGGYCYLNKNARIELNTYGIGGTVRIEGDGHFSIDGGMMYANEDGRGSNIENDEVYPRFGTVYVSGNMTFYSGEVSHDYVSIGVAGNLMYGTVAGAKLFTDAIKMFKGGTISLGAGLSGNVNLLFDNEVADGDVIIRGTDSYQLTTSDLACFRLPDGFSLKAEGNTFVLSKAGSTGVIATVDQLQAAIDAAPAGTVDNPTELTITSAGIDFNKTVTIKGKHIKLVGNNVVYSNILTSNIRMFSVESKGSLTIENATLLGTKTGTNAYCSFLFVDYGSSALLNKVTMQKSLSQLDTWTMLRIYGSCALKDCIISENNGDALILIGSNGNCRIEGGKIQNNSCTDSKYVYNLIRNLGTLDYVSGEYTNNHAISLSSQGTTTLRSVHIRNYLSTLIKDEGSGIFVYGNLNLYNTATIGDDFYMDKSGSRRGCLNIYGQLKSNLGLVCHDAEDGWVIAKGADYMLTQADLQKFVLAQALAKEYTLKKVDNTFVLSALKAKSYNVKTETCQNGKISADKVTAAQDEMVTVTATPLSGYKLYKESLSYNKTGKLQSTNKTNIFTFKMPAVDALITAEFIPDGVTVAPVDTSKFDPDNDLIPDTGIGNLDSLIAILNPKEIYPKAQPVPDEDLPGILQDEVKDAERNGDEVIGSLEELIDIVSGNGGGQSQTYYDLPVKLTIVCYLPKIQVAGGLRVSSEAGNYYILNESKGRISRIVPTYDAESNALIFQTSRLGVFTVMRSNSSTAAEEITLDALKIESYNKEIVISNLPVGKPYAIYNAAGQLLDTGTGNGLQIRYRPSLAGIYIVEYKEGAQKVYVQ